MAPIPENKTPADGNTQLLPPGNNVSETRIALVALIFAAIAFVAAFFQALLQYLTSVQRDKCLRGAIGEWSMYTKTRWDLWRWRIRVEYPRLNLDLGPVLTLRAKGSSSLTKWSHKNIPELRSGVCSAKSYERKYETKINSLFWYIEDYGDIVLGPNDREPLTFWDLKATQKVSWLWFSLTKRNSGQPPYARAGWCNLLTTLGVSPAAGKDLVASYENADIIPSGIDVPIQRMPLFQLSIFCYMANIKEVEVNTMSGTINGHNSYIKVNTQEIPGLGKFVTIDGDFEGLQMELGIANSSQLLEVCHKAKGILTGHMLHPSIDNFDENAFLFASVRGWEQEDWQKHKSRSLTSTFNSFPTVEERIRLVTRVSPTRQAELYSKCIAQNPAAEWAEVWKSVMGSSTPTIIKYLAIMPFAGIWTAAPLKLFFGPYRDHFRKKRQQWLEKALLKDGVAEFIPHIENHEAIEISLISGGVPFLREISNFCISGNSIPVLPESYSWVWYPNLPVLELWESDIPKQALKTDERVLFLPEVAVKLIDGSLSSIGEADGYIRFSTSTLNPMYTTQSAILLSLLLVDGRLQALWTLLEEDGCRFSKLASGLGKSASDSKSRLKLINDAVGMDMLTADFIALWFELGNRVDLLSDTDSLIQNLSQVLEEWEDDDAPCIASLSPATEKHVGVDSHDSTVTVEESTPENTDSIELVSKQADHVGPIGKDAEGESALPIEPSITPDTSDLQGGESLVGKLLKLLEKKDPYRKMNGLKSRKELVLWARGETNNGTKRFELICKMVSLLQLRIFLMGLSYDCHSDSSDAYLAEAGKNTAVRVI